MTTSIYLFSLLFFALPSALRQFKAKENDKSHFRTIHGRCTIQARQVLEITSNKKHQKGDSCGRCPTGARTR